MTATGLSMALQSAKLQLALTYMLIYEDDSNVLAFLGEAVECLLDLGCLRLGVDDEEVALGRWRVGDVLRVHLVHCVFFDIGNWQ